MKKLLITTMFTMIVCFTYSQWNWSNPTPFGYHLSDVHFPDENTGYIVGEKGTVLKTTDAGASWNFMPSGTLRRLEMVWFTDAETGYVTSDSGFIMKTTDGGETWLELQSGTTEEFNDIYFYNETLGFIAGMNGQLLRTTNGGETWERASIDIYSDVYSIYFVNENVGYAAASMRTVFKTIDGGDSWTSTSGDPYLDLRSIFFLDAFKGYVSGEDNFMMKTTNGGFSWTQFQSNRPIKQMQFINELTGYALSDNELVKTTNGGTTWTPLGMTDCLSYSFANSNIVFGVGYSGRILKSADVGISFVNYTSSVTEADLVDVHFPDENTGYAISQYDVSTGLRKGQVLKNTDAGETWQITADGDFGRLTSVYFTSVNTGYMVCSYGKIYKTTDGGYLWDTLAGYSGLSLTEVTFVNENTGFVAGEGNGAGTILKTNDGGMSWSSIYDGDRPVRGIHFIDENVGYAILYSSVIKTINGGMEWTETSLSNEGILLDIFFVNQDVGYVCGFMGDFYKTTDGGETWIKLPTPFSNSLICMYFVDENTGYMCGDGCTFFQTDNGGINWTSLDYFSCSWSNSVWFTDDLNGYIVGGNGKILKTTNGGLVSSGTHQKPGSGFTLFPNPANSTITINTADNTNGLQVKISVLNCNGMQVIKGKYHNLPVQMDISALAAGIYLLRIETANAVETRKLIKM
jgi:photosystem II stability/assembly factor-like uncharacterized protein